MKKNESKATDKSTRKVTTKQQPENTKSVEATTALATDESSSGTATPSDGEGCESVTVIIIARNEKHGELMLRSVKKNLIGVDADVHLVTGDNVKNTDVETLLAQMPEVKTERIVLMTEGVFILNPSTIFDIGARKTPAANMPALMYKSVLEPLLKQMKEELPYADVADTYARVTPEVTPAIIGNWRKDPWLLPVISKNPPREALEEYGAWKKFMHVSPDSWSPDLVKFLENRFPE